MKRNNIYLNVVIQPEASNGVNNTLAKYDQTLTNAVLQCPEDYEMSIIRFSLPIDQIPLFKFPMNTSQADPNISYCQIGIRALGVNYMQPIVYVPRNALSPPTAGVAPEFFTNDQSVSNYYDVFSINHMLEMINTALALAWTASGHATVPAYYTWDSTSELISLWIPAAMYAAGHQVVVNKYMKDYLSSFEYYRDDNTVPAGLLFYHINNPKIGNVGGFHLHEQEYVSIALWMDIRKILIVSRTLPIAPEILPDQITTQTSQLPVFNGLSSTLPIVSDFVLSYDQFNQISSVIVYNPAAQYRYVDLIGRNPINKIDLQFFYQDRFGNKFPIYISPNNECSIKIAFIRK